MGKNHPYFHVHGDNLLNFYTIDVMGQYHPYFCVHGHNLFSFHTIFMELYGFVS